MDLLASVTPLFSPTSRARGLDYVRAGRIDVLEQSPTVIRLVAIGTEDYEVLIRKDGSRLGLRCECRYFADRFACKHIWGALLVVKADPALADWMRYTAEDVTFDFPGDDRAAAASSGVRSTAPAVSDAVQRFLDYRERHGLGSPGGDGRPGIVTPFAQRGGDVDGSVTWKAPFDRIRDAMAREDAAAPAWADISPGEIVYLVDTLSSVTYGSLTVAIARRDRRKSGDWGKPKPLRIRRSQVAQLPDDTDRRLVALLLGSSEWYGGIDYHVLPPQLHVPPDLAAALLPALCATHRLFLARGGAIESAPLRWNGDEPWRFRLRVRPGGENGAGRYYVSGWLVRSGTELPLSEPRLVTPTLAFFREDVAPLDPGDAWSWLLELRGNPSIAVPASQAARFVDTLLTLPRVPAVELPDELRVEERGDRPVPGLRLFHGSGALPPPIRGAFSAGGGRDPVRMPTRRVSAELSFDYAGTRVAAAQPGATIYLPEPRVLIRRDVAAERGARAELLHLGFRPEPALTEADARLAIDPHRLPHAIRDLIAAGWRVEADGKLYRSAGRARLSVKSGIDWFELHGEAEFGDQVADLPRLLKALAKGERFVTLGDGSLGLLPEEWLRRFAGIAELGEAVSDHVRFRPSQVAVLDALLAAQPETGVDEIFDHARQALREFDRVAPMDAPATFVGELRGYQREGIGWLEFLRTFRFGGCLADDMGLGKTVMVLALLERHREEMRLPSLVVAPRSVVFNWLREAERFTPQLRLADYTGPARAQVLDRLDTVDLLVTTYGTVRQDAARLKDIPFEYVVLDESQAIKNAATASAKAARLLSANHRLALSGTPIENHVGELWSLFDFLNPGMLGSRAVFGRKSRKAGQEREAGAAGAEAGDEDADQDDRADVQLLARAVRPFILRRTKAQVAHDLPERQEETIWCELEGADRRLYDELRDHYKATLLGVVQRNGLERSKLQVLEALLRLRQAACHPGLLDRSRAGGTSAKLEALLPQLAELREEGHKAIVFSQFTSLLAILRRHLDADRVPYEYLDGQTRDREARVARFQESEDCRVFLVSLKAGGLGLNLTAADYVFLLDPWWNPAVEAQAIDRAHRIGQTRPVFAYRLIARDTVEERILDLQRQKRDLAEAIITEDNSVIANLTREELESLLS